MFLNLEMAEQIVESLKPELDIFWDSYDICIFRPDPRAEFDVNGIFRNQNYGFLERFEILENGNWEINV